MIASPDSGRPERRRPEASARPTYNPPQPDFPRLVPDEPLPPYRHLPGATPHPVTHPDGHSFGAKPEVFEPGSGLPPERWREDRGYLQGVDLFNHGYWWEAHEAWEGCWRRARRPSPQRELLQGLIQVAAACLRRRSGSVAGRRNLAARGLARLRNLARDQGPQVMGLEVRSFTDAAEAWLEGEGPFPFIRLPADARRP